MKKTVLLILAMWCGAMFAQAPVNTEPELAKNKIFTKQVLDRTVDVVTKPVVKMPSKSSSKIGIHTSSNIYTLLVSETTCLTANQDLNAIMFTARGDAGTGMGVGSGSIVVSCSQTYGYSWKNILATNDGKGNRYPSGVIYNPTGNTNIENAYAVVSGPTTDGSGWMENFWGSVKLDSTSQNVVYENYSVFAQDFPRYGMAAPGSGKIHVLGDKYTTGPPFIYEYAVMNTGTFNPTNNNFDWNRVKIYNKMANPAQDMSDEISSWNTAWSPDGSVGYVYFIGIDSANPNTSYQPVVLKSVDLGATWTKLPFYDFANSTVLQANIWGTLYDSTLQRPFFSSECEAVVDNNGNLHMVGVITGAYSINPDSLGYTFKYEPKELYHYYTTSTGWEVEHIGTINTLTVLAAESGFGTGADAVGWDHRVQMSRTADGTKIFAVWADSDTAFFTNVLAPDINVWGKDLTNNIVYPITNFTTGTVNDGVCYFHYVSDITLEFAGNVLIPVTFAKLGVGPADPVEHYFLPGIGYGPTVGVKEVVQGAPLSIIGSFPNPASDITNIRINLGSAADVNVEVFNIAGQKIHAVEYGRLPEGENRLQLDVANLNSGMYVYVVQAGQTKATGKMIRR